MIELRPYQIDAIKNTREAMRESKKVILSLPTGCIAGDSIIGLNRAKKGYSRTIERAFNAKNNPRRKENIKTKIRSFLGDRIGLNDVVDIVYTGIKFTCELELVNGKKIRATPEHNILTKRGWVKLECLFENDFVVCEKTDIKKIEKNKKPIYKQVQGLKYHPYANKVVSNRRNEGRLYRVPLHRLIVEANINRISLDELIEMCRVGYFDKEMEFIDPKKYAVHHKDGDTYNNYYLCKKKNKNWANFFLS